MNPPPSRVLVLGTTGSGKMTVAREIAARLAIPVVELDALHRGPGWAPVATDVVRRRVAEAIQGDGWVVDGNYSKVRDIVWPRAETIVWFDYALPVILGRLVPRTLRQLITRETLWHGNRESWWTTFFSRDSLFVWVLQPTGGTGASIQRSSPARNTGILGWCGSARRRPPIDGSRACPIRGGLPRR